MKIIKKFNDLILGFVNEWWLEEKKPSEGSEPSEGYVEMYSFKFYAWLNPNIVLYLSLKAKNIKNGFDDKPATHSQDEVLYF